MDIKNRHCEGTEQALSLSPAEDKKDNYIYKHLKSNFMEKKKFVVYYNDEVNEVSEVFSADTLEECKHWIDLQLECMIPVDEEHPCTDDVMYSAKTFYYEVYDKPIVEYNGSENASDWVYNDAVYSTSYYYAK